MADTLLTFGFDLVTAHRLTRDTVQRTGARDGLLPGRFSVMSPPVTPSNSAAQVSYSATTTSSHHDGDHDDHDGDDCCTPTYDEGFFELTSMASLSGWKARFRSRSPVHSFSVCWGLGLRDCTCVGSRLLRFRRRSNRLVLGQFAQRGKFRISLNCLNRVTF